MKKFLVSLFSGERFRKITLPILLVIVLAIIGFASFRPTAKIKDLTPDMAKAKAEQFINSFLMTSGDKATIKEITTEYGLYKLRIDIVSDIVESYLSKDGKLFFPQALDINQITSSASSTPTESNNAAPVTEVSVKNDKPVVELFVMSYCPYGTQIEKGILPVLAALGNKIAFELKFCDYAMHGQKELTENLNQYCIQKEQPTKLSAYLECFLESSNSGSCLTSAGVNVSKMDACVSKTDKQYKVMDNFNNKVGYQGTYPGFDVYKADNLKYNVGGSPTLIINGQEIASGRDSASLLKTICSAFKNQPKECSTVLSGASPSAGFGSGTAANGSADVNCE